MFIDPSGDITDGDNRFIHRYDNSKPSTQQDVYINVKRNEHFNTFAPENERREDSEEENVQIRRRR